MALKHSHVPKFGNWDSDNVPYSAFFENALKERTRVRMNPNDPEENPEAFLWGTIGMETDGDCQPVHAHHHVDSNKSTLEERHHNEGHMGYHNPRGRNTFDHCKSWSQKSTTSDFSNDKNNLDHSLQPGHRHLKSDQKKSPTEGSNSFSLSIPGHSRQRSGNHLSDETHHRIASVPKFGAWDETDPKSGEGFTVIFNKVKEEKQISSTKFPTVPAQTTAYSDGQTSSNGSSSSRSKICCCPFWRRIY